MEVPDWLNTEAAGNCTAPALVAELGARLLEAGVPIWRISSSFSSMHPEVAFYNMRWKQDEGTVVHLRPLGILNEPFYTDSPVAHIYARGEPELRRRLAGPDAVLDYPICRDLAAEGATDYLVQLLPFRKGHWGYVAYATRVARGFTDGELGSLRVLLPMLALRMQVHCLEHTMRSLLHVYLGKNAAQRVLAGAVTRGSGTSIEAAIWYCDLRGFTSLSDRVPAAEVVATLDRYFETVAGPIESHGGEILKFIGDGVLAIFPVQDGDRAEACGRALKAAHAALAAMRGGEVAMGLALHVGEVNYGNIGARERLDFTVIGAAVNEVCRVEAMCKQLARPLLVTAAFARACPAARFESLGQHPLRGVAAAQELFAPTQA